MNYDHVTNNSQQSTAEPSTSGAAHNNSITSNSPMNSTFSSDGHINIRDFLEAAQLNDSSTSQIDHIGIIDSQTSPEANSSLANSQAPSNSTQLVPDNPFHGLLAQPETTSSAPQPSGIQTLARAVIPNPLLSPRRTRQQGQAQGKWTKNGEFIPKQ